SPFPSAWHHHDQPTNLLAPGGGARGEREHGGPTERNEGLRRSGSQAFALAGGEHQRHSPGQRIRRLPARAGPSSISPPAAPPSGESSPEDRSSSPAGVANTMRPVAVWRTFDTRTTRSSPTR